MEEEIVVDDIDDNSTAETQQADDSTTPVMPLLYIQQNKVRSNQSASANQTLVSPNTQLAAIINPVNNQIVTGQNKVFIQGPSQVATSQSKQHIVIHRPINTVSTTATPQTQKHILLRKSNTSTAQIVPLNTTQGSQTNAQVGKHTFAYLGTLIKPNKSRESVVIPAGALSTTQITKPKLVIAPVISQLAQTSTSTTSGSQSQPPKHMANLLLPVNIPQQSGATKPSMFNLKINNGQLSTESKGTITVLRESKTTNSTTHPPPLHPIAKMSLLNANKGSSNSIDSIKITENPDSAVITPIPKKEDNQPEKRKKTISNILRGSAEKRMKKQNIPKSPQDSLADTNYALSSPESEQDKDKKGQNDDDITLIKVVPSEDKVSKLNTNMDDDIKIEIIKAPTNCNVEAMPDNKCEAKSNNHDETKEQLNNLNQNNSNFDATKVLDWKDGVGTLPGSNLQFRMNEFGIMEVVDEDESSKQNKDGIGDKENVCLTQNSSKSSPATVNNANTEKKADDRKSRSMNADTMYHCEGCGCYGLAAEFESPISCSPSCTEQIESRKQTALRKEKELKEVRMRKKRKRLLQESQWAKEMDEKSDDKMQDKAKSETDDEKDTIVGIDDESQGDSLECKYPWQRGKLGFSWPKYLDHCKAKAAPVKLFKDPFPYSKNHFRVGMKLEGIDPERPSRYCVLTIVEVVGYRMRLHFDGYPENYDFWVNADSMNIFPAGWAEKNGKKLDPPKGYTVGNFNWNAYLKLCKATAAAKNIFPNKSVLQTVFPTCFRVGMKLEAVDRKHSTLLCVASIAGLMDSRILVHFDSWDEVYDYWADVSSPYIHPVGWSHHNGITLVPPNNKDAKSFTWDAYLREMGATAAPARAFKQRPPCAFKRGMKLEAVDMRVPQLIRLATVVDVQDHRLKIKFDGWPDSHAYWVDDDSPDIHPAGWCLKTGHPLEPPLTPDNLNDRPECGTYGCRGIGHIKGPKFATHNSASGCPYSPQNLNKKGHMPDRLSLMKYESYEFEEEMLEKPKLEKIDKIKMDKSEKYVFSDERLIIPEKEIKLEDGDLSDKNDKFENRSENSEKSNKSKNLHSDGQTDDDEVSKKRKKKSTILEEPLFSVSNTNSTYSDLQQWQPIPYAANMPDKQLRKELYQSVYNPGYNPLPNAPHVWAKHSNALNRVVAKQTTNPRRWSNEEVIKFVQSVPNCAEAGNIVRQNNIDGEAFLMLTQEDLVSVLRLRLGPAIKLYNSIVLLRQKAS
ncbi:lethal(3)malignant brain tumor-like protein 3 isoform X2 [Linepithema humile]|nr:PREDICTED: lethal(3)malignant brain tumor-like protein 3 isoform X2 [Linepithema humile]XP_012227521.1 PREDICTED: lethal(3)malignant brain tumor-like protein 3 isoform X2 [Linepithema humile]XP_012227522.1 PREDICTED: lethal(3)malignant brain tumor-like protein 3 isoform X2 [Linepithema humile]XP_012227523.1 PREDICTED: lethal(3)malignant brain tumor-like protein 3 isoform X2 [Linepithema humile]